MQCTCGDPDCEMEMWVGENYVLIAELQKSVEAIKQHKPHQAK